MGMKVRLDVTENSPVHPIGARYRSYGALRDAQVIDELVSEILGKGGEIFGVLMQNQETPTWETGVVVETQRRARQPGYW